MRKSTKRTGRAIDVETELERYHTVAVIIAAYEIQIRSAASHALFPTIPRSRFFEIGRMSAKDKRDYAARLRERDQLKAWFKEGVNEEPNEHHPGGSCFSFSCKGSSSRVLSNGRSTYRP